MAATNLSAIVTQTVGNSTAGVNLITAPNDSSIWTASTITKSTTTTAAELPLSPAVPTATKFALTASPGSAYCDFECPAALFSTKLGLGWFARASSTLTATITLTLKCYSSTSNRTSDTSATTVSLQSSSPAGLAAQFYTTFDSHASNPYYRLTIAFTGQASVFYSIAQFQVGPGVMVQGAAISDWISYSVTQLKGATTQPTHPTAGTNTFNAKYRRIGSTMHLLFAYSQTTITGAADGSGAYGVPLPPGLTFDASVFGKGGAVDYTYGTAMLRAGTGFYSGSVGMRTMSTGENLPCIIGLEGNNGTTASSSAYYWGGGAGTAGGLTSGTSYEVEINCIIPIVEWAGSAVNMGAGSQVEYAWNSTATATSDTTGLNTGYGPQGVLFQAFAPTGTNSVDKYVKFQYPIQADDLIVIEVDEGSGGARWLPLDSRLSGFGVDAASPTFYWGTILSFIDSNTVSVRFFSRQGLASTATWAGLSTWRWRVRKCKASSPTGFGKSNSNEFGLVAPRKGQYSLTVTGTGWTTLRAVGVYYQDQDGTHRLKFNIAGSVTSSARTFFQVSITGITAKNVTDYFQPVAPFAYGAAVAISNAYISNNSNVVSWEHASATTTKYAASGDIELDSKPTWA